MTETDLAAAWGAWLTARLTEKGWRQADLVRESGGLIKRDRASKWSSGQERPSHRLAIVTANTLHISHDEALEAAGYTASYELPEALVRENEERRAYERTPEGIRAMNESAAQFDLSEALGDFLVKRDARSLVLSTVPSEELLAEIQRRLAGAPAPWFEENVAPLDEDQEDYGLAARPRSVDRGEDIE